MVKLSLQDSSLSLRMTEGRLFVSPKYSLIALACLVFTTSINISSLASRIFLTDLKYFNNFSALATGLAARDVAVVSGAAYGIDGAAHRAALAADGLTLAVLAGGLDVPYPAGHAQLLQRIGAHGLLVSEYPPGVRPARHRFLTRNRLVAALSGATVVVEAGVRSGAANTAAWARGLGRVVCAVPGPVTSSSSVGCHQLLRGGAELVTRADEVVEVIGRVGELAAPEPGPRSPLDGLTDTERHVYDALPAGGRRTADEIGVAAGLAPTQVLGPLAMLEVAGLVVRRDGCWQLSASRAPERGC
jgi:DNA processing protein